MKIFLLAVPYDSGHYKKRLGLGTLTLLDNVDQHLTAKNHKVRKQEILVEDNAFPTEVTTSFEVSRNVSREIRGAKTQGEFPVVFSGNCNTAVGTLGGLHNGCGVIWFDCHGDFNTPETTLGGFLDGMALSMVTGHCWKQLTGSVPGFVPVPEENIVLIGARDFDPQEMHVLSASRVMLLTSAMIRQGKNALDEMLPGLQSVYLHIDLDVIDPEYVKVNGYSTPGGLMPEDLYNVVEQVMKKFTISALAFTAYDPSFDPEHKIHQVVTRIIDIVLS
jgi:arginase